jgi:integrase
MARRPFAGLINDADTLVIAGQLLEEGDQEFDIRQTHWRAFLAHCQVNNFHPYDGFQDAIPTFAASILQQGRSPGTAVAYLKHVHECWKEARSNLATVVRALRARMAREGTTHALDMDTASLQHIIQRISKTSVTFGRICAFLWYSGMRSHDLTELRRKHVCFSDGYLRVEVHFTKTIRGPADGVELRIPCDWLPELDLETINSLVAHVTYGDPDDLLFAEAEASDVNAAMRQACIILGMSPQAGRRQFPTTYTFRRAFVHAMEERFRDPTTGIVNWSHVTQYTLHQTERCVRAYYSSSVSDTQLAFEEIFGE